jgi:3-dehydroquinate dehydratase/shikimate dehydrogenase
MTDIVAPIFVRSTQAALPQVVAAVNQGADMLELRCDEASGEAIADILARPEVRCKPVIVTIRAKAEGGLFSGSESERLRQILFACRLKPDYVDIEYDTWRQNADFVAEVLPLLAEAGKAASGKPKLILSNHDFSSRPINLKARLLAMAGIAAVQIVKAAYKAESLADALEALRLYQELPEQIRQPLVIIAMGEAGLITRLLAAKYAAAFTFAVPSGCAMTAPGQPTIKDLIHTYRFKKQRPDWPVYGVIGWPVAHSISPMIHNAGFDAVDVPGVYVPLPIAPEYQCFHSTVNALRELPALNLRGASVTIPHKANAAKFLLGHGGVLDDTSARIGVINTLYFPHGGPIRGTNSDWCGAIDALRDGMQWSLGDLVQRRIAVLGAGGAARAIVAGLATLGANVTIYNRTLKRAQELAHEFNGKTGSVSAAQLDELRRTKCNVIINCTPAGMSPHEHTVPIDDFHVIDSSMVIFDTVYNPRRTRLLDIAARRGAKTIEGLEMLLRQAVVQFEGFTGKPAPLSVMRVAAEAALDRKA